MTEMKVVLAYLLRHFRFEALDHRDKILAMMEMVYRPKSPLRLRVHERRKAETFVPESMDMLMKARLSLDGSTGGLNGSLLDLGLGGSNSSSSADSHLGSDDHSHHSNQSSMDS